MADSRFFSAAEFEADRLAAAPRPSERRRVSRLSVAITGITALMWAMMILRVALAAYHGRLG